MWSNYGTHFQLQSPRHLPCCLEGQDTDKAGGEDINLILLMRHAAEHSDLLEMYILL
jgi:hypothetical protein